MHSYDHLQIAFHFFTYSSRSAANINFPLNQPLVLAPSMVSLTPLQAKKTGLTQTKHSSHLLHHLYICMYKLMLCHANWQYEFHQIKYFYQNLFIVRFLWDMYWCEGKNVAIITLTHTAPSGHKEVGSAEVACAVLSTLSNTYYKWIGCQNSHIHGCGFICKYQRLKLRVCEYICACQCKKIRRCEYICKYQLADIRACEYL